MIYTILLLIALLVVGLRTSKNNVFSPGVITPAVWLFCLLMFNILTNALPDLSSQFFFALNLWVLSFMLLFLIMQKIKTPFEKNSNPSQLVLDIYFLISLCTYPLLLHFAYQAITLGAETTWTSNLRLAAIGKTGPFKEVFGPFYILIWKASYLIELFFYSKKNRKRLIILVFLFLSYVFVTMSKAIMLDIIMITLCLLFLKKIITIKHIIIGLFVLFFLFFGFHLLRDTGSLSKNNFLVLYLLSSMSAFDTLIPCSSYHLGENVFRILYAISHSLGLTNIEPISPILPWINKPIQTNTYTGMYPFFKDFGYYGVVFFGSFFGFVFGWIFNKVQKGDVFFILLFSSFVGGLILQYVGELFFTIIAGHIKFVFVLIFPFIASKYRLFHIKSSIV